jgi:hypothetical protein
MGGAGARWREIEAVTAAYFTTFVLSDRDKKG